MATKMCVHTLSLSVESTQSLLPSGLPICPGQPASQSPSLPMICPICQLPKTAQGHSGQNYFIVIQVSILWGPTQAHIFCYRGIVQECLIASQILQGQFYSWQLNSLIILIGISKYIGQILILVLNSLIFRNQYLEYNIPRNKESSLQFAGAATLNLRELDESSHPSFNSGLDIGALWSEL